MENIFRNASYVLSSLIKSLPLITVTTAVDTWHSCSNKVDRIRIILIGGKAGSRFWDRQSALSSQFLGNAVKLLSLAEDLFYNTTRFRSWQMTIG